MSKYDGYTPVLDKGYVKLIEHWGGGEANDHESGIIEAARQSTDGNFKGWDNDTKLLKYLWDAKHGTPFEFAGAVFEVQAPIMVFREWFRHRTQSFNELSARYVEMKPMFYIPSDERLLAGGQSKTNKQASGQPLDADVVGMARTVIEQSGMRAYQEYQTLLDHGVARELARLVLPVNIYSRMRVAANLRNWCGFLTLREAPNAQFEIREFAHTIAGSLATIFPHVLELHQASRAT